jgi:hypothetical protein
MMNVMTFQPPSAGLPVGQVAMILLGLLLLAFVAGVLLGRKSRPVPKSPSLAYIKDADFSRRSDQTVLHCNSILQAVCEFDNVQFWNLDNVPGLP